MPLGVPPAKRPVSSKPRPKPKAVQPKPLKVAVTGPTGDIGRAFLRALDADPRIGKVIGMARRPFDTAAAGLSEKVSYRQGDITDPESLRETFDGADVVVHLAFIIVGKADETHDINVEGSRNVFEAAVAAGAKRLIYTSSVAAYGFHDENPQPLTEDVPPSGTETFGYSKQKGELEDVLRDVVGDSDIEAYLFRPCIVAGGDALALVRLMPFVQIGQKVPGPLRDAVAKLPGVAPVLPDPGTRFQLVHTEDVASAMLAAVKGKGEPGVYNLAAPGEITTSDLAREFGWHSVPIPHASLDVTAALTKRIPLLPAQAEWVQAFRVEVLMSIDKARKELDWEPQYDTLDTLRDTVSSARAEGLLAD
jgi:nucleoside-diphosphate-sugar epimerase